MKSLTVVFVTPVFAEVREGPAIYAQYLYRHFLDNNAVDFHIVTLEADNPAPNVHCSGRAKNSIATYLKLQNYALKVCQELGADIVHGNCAHAMWKFVGYDRPVICQVNDYDPIDVWRNAFKYCSRNQVRRFLSLLWRRGKEKQVCLAADRIVCNSRYTKQALVREYGVSDVKAEIIYKAVDLEAFAKPELLPADPCKLSGNGKRLIFLGTNWRRKGLDSLVRALPAVRSYHPEVKLDVVGPELAELSEELLTYIRENSLDEVIHFSGRVSRSALPSHLWWGDLFVLPSHDEALGVSILEALAAGVPVVASNVGGIPEILEGMPCGKMLPPGDVSMLAAEITRVLDNEETLHRMGQAAVQCAARFSLLTMFERVEKLYTQMAESRPLMETVE